MNARTYFLYGIVDGLVVTTERISAANVDVVGTLDGGGGLHLQRRLGENSMAVKGERLGSALIVSNWCVMP